MPSLSTSSLSWFLSPYDPLAIALSVIVVVVWIGFWQRRSLSHSDVIPRLDLSS